MRMYYWMCDSSSGVDIINMALFDHIHVYNNIVSLCSPGQVLALSSPHIVVVSAL